MLDAIFKAYGLVLPKTWPIALLSGVALGLALAHPTAQAHMAQLSTAAERDLKGVLEGRAATAVVAEITTILGSRGFWIAVALITVWSIVVFTMVLVRVGDLAAGREGSIATAMISGARLAPAMLAVSALYLIVTCVGSLLFVVPGVVLSVSLLFMPTAIVEEGCGAAASIARSWKLVTGEWWWTAANSTLAIVIGLVASSIVQSVWDLIAAAIGLSSPLTMLLESVLNSVLLLPFYAAILVCMHRELKVRERKKLTPR